MAGQLLSLRQMSVNRTKEEGAEGVSRAQCESQGCRVSAKKIQSGHIVIREQDVEVIR